MWSDTAIFITWDDWGGFYDHVPPQQIDDFGLGIRVPLLVISPYAKQGFVDHTSTGSSRRCCGSSRTTGACRRSPSATPVGGNLLEDFDFSQPPRPPDPRPQRTDCIGNAFTRPPSDAYT